MLKKIFLLFSIILCSVFLTGCINLKVADEFTVKEDRSIEHSYQILVGNNMYAFANRINETISEALSEKGFSNIVDAYDSDYFGKKGTQYYELDNGMGNAISSNYVSVNDNSQDYFVFKHVDITAYIDFQKILNENNDKDLVSFTEYKLTINLPVAFTETNAHNVYNDGKSATWRFVPSSGSGTIHFECNVPNKQNIQIILICVACLFGLILLIRVLTFILSFSNRQNDIIKCPKCGEKLEEGTLFCGNCGYNLNQDSYVEEISENQIKCPNCSAILKESDEFCGECGFKVNNKNDNFSKPKCPNCGVQLNDDDMFCGNCGYNINEKSEEDNYEM